MREFLVSRQFKAGMITMLIGACVLTILAPFETASIPFATRGIYWVCMVYVGGVFIMPVQVFAIRLADRTALPALPSLAIAAALAAVPATLGVSAVDNLMRPPPQPPGYLPVLWMQVTAIGFVIGALAHAHSILPVGSKVAAGPSALVRRLDPDLGTDLISMSMQDHYIDVTTARGSQLLLMRMTDAIAETPPTNGLRIHRSHWVSFLACGSATQ